jgi:hypothetical protein
MSEMETKVLHPRKKISLDNKPVNILYMYHPPHLLPLSYTILLEDLLGTKKCRQKHGGSDAISMMTTLTLFLWQLPLTNLDPKLPTMSLTPLVFCINILSFLLFFN